MPELKNIKGKDLPFFMLKALNATPFHTFRIVPETEIEYDDEGNPLPPEEHFSEKFVNELELQCKTDNKNTIFETKEELICHINNLWRSANE
jgi:hypothetical protein